MSPAEFSAASPKWVNEALGTREASDDRCDFDICIPRALDLCYNKVRGNKKADYIVIPRPIGMACHAEEISWLS